MARPASCFNTINYVIGRQYDDRSRVSKSFTKNKLGSARSFYRKDLLAHYGCVNAIEFSHDGKQLVSGGDDRRVLLWRVDESLHNSDYKPMAMRAQHASNIFCLAFNSNNEKIYSAGNDDQVIVHDAATGEVTDYYLHEQPVYGLSIDPMNDHIFASACDDGRILMFDTREPGSNESTCLATYTSAFHGVMFNPVESRLLATANSKEGVALWDVRRPGEELVRYGGDNATQSCMSVRFNQRGTHILALRRRLPPVLYHAESQNLCAQFDHPGYYNSCTMKSCSFAGDNDEFVLSGSDDFNLYMWKIPSLHKNGQWVAVAHMILKGHRSIVNQVRFNSANSIIASSGVEKLIKFWSPFQLPGASGGPIDTPDKSTELRKVFTHEEYITLVLQSGQFMSHDYSQESTLEDPRMMAFFDSLVQREIEGWSSEESIHSNGSAQRSQASRVLPFSASESASSGPDDDDAARAYVEALQAKHNVTTELNNTSQAGSSEQAAGSAPAGPPEQSNRITELIAKKRAQLMKLARAKLSSDVRTARRKKRNTSSLTRFGIDNNSTTASSADTSSESESWVFHSGTSSKTKTTKKSQPNGVNGVKRLPASSTSDDSDTSVPVQQRNRKRQRTRKSSSSSTNSIVEPTTPQSKIITSNNSENSTSGHTSVPNHNALKLSIISSSHDSSELDEWDKPGLSSDSKKYSATPDSGIELSASKGNGSISQPVDSNDECDKLPVFTKSCKNRFKRNYRSRIATDSDSD